LSSNNASTSNGDPGCAADCGERAGSAALAAAAAGNTSASARDAPLAETGALGSLAVGDSGSARDALLEDAGALGSLAVADFASARGVVVANTGAWGPPTVADFDASDSFVDTGACGPLAVADFGTSRAPLLAAPAAFALRSSEGFAASRASRVVAKLVSGAGAAGSVFAGAYGLLNADGFNVVASCSFAGGNGAFGSSAFGSSSEPDFVASGCNASARSAPCSAFREAASVPGAV
jgi:hypothetical protein